MVSIGGANNSPLAAACKNVKDLQKLYYDIVDNMNLNVLDFDIEGTWVADQDSIDRRNQAVKEVQAQWKEEGRKVGIWYTLPILPTGLTAEGLYVLENARHAGVELAGINVMTMDYGNAVCQSDGTEGQNIHGKCATSAIDNMFTQLKKIWPEKSDKEINAMMGTTPMIGYNDVQGEVFYLSDAKLVMEDAKKRNLGMIGAWSMARDQPGVAKQVSPEHSGMTAQQAPMYAYSQVFAPFTHADEKEVVTGVYKSRKNNLCLDVKNGQIRNGDRLFTYACSGSNNQTFKFDAREHLVIGNSQSCLDIQNGYNVEGRNIISYTCHTPTDTNKNQAWTWQNNKFVSQKEGTQRCMTVGNDGYVTLSTCTDNNVAQEFEIYRP